MADRGENCELFCIFDQIFKQKTIDVLNAKKVSNRIVSVTPNLIIID